MSHSPVKYNTLSVNGVFYRWFSSQNSQHPDFIFVCEQGEIWVQVEDTFDKKQCDLYIKGLVESPVSNSTAKLISEQIIINGYQQSYFIETDVGLSFSESGKLEEI